MPEAALRPGASLVLEGDDKALDRLFARIPLEQTRDVRELSKEGGKEELRTIEAVIQHGSLLIGRSDERITQRVRDVRLRVGDVLVLRAGEKTLPEALGALGLLPLVERMVTLGDRRRIFMPAGILAVAMVVVATGAGCDFLTPIGHQCNTQVMGPGGYRFHLADGLRLVLPCFLPLCQGRRDDRAIPKFVMSPHDQDQANPDVPATGGRG